MNNVIIYIRVSTKEQLEGTSLEVQKYKCLDYSSSQKYEVTKIFEERGESAKTTDRPALKDLLEFVAKNHKNLYGVLVYKIDRLARDTGDHAYLKVFFRTRGVRLLSATENLEDTPVGRLIENQLAGFAQFDNEIRTERSKNGMIEAVKQGRYVWKAPIGYINTGGRGTSNLAFGDSSTVKKIRLLWEYIDSGCEIFEATKKLTEEHNLHISKSNIHRMLRNKIYMGVIEKFGLSRIGIHLNH
jgi:DNA invertase Pin-like site-specific DNA recombinase